MKLDRIEIADESNPAKLAAAVINQLSELNGAVPVHEIALALDIIDIQPLETAGFEGGLITDEAKAEGIILYNGNSPQRRQKFSIAHELGHFLSPWHRPADGMEFMCSSQDMSRFGEKVEDRAARMEVEANQFAAELLLPRKLLHRDIRRLAGIDLEHVLRISDKYDISREATARRYVDLCDEPCAVIFSHEGRVRYPYRNRHFPFVEISAGDLIPRDSIAARSDLQEGKVSDWSETDGSTWLVANRGTPSRPLVEQTLLQHAGYRVTLVTFADDEEAIDDDIDYEEAWAVRFKRR